MKWIAATIASGTGRLALALAVGTLALSCSSRRADQAGSKTDSAAAAGTMQGSTPNSGASSASADSGMQAKMKGMPGMSGMSHAGGDTVATMMDQMQMHMQMLDGMSGDSMKAMLGMHRSMVASMISQTNDQMRKMNMPASAAWNTITDSIRQDLVRMPDMSASQLHTFIPEHHARIMRFMQMHRSMMAGMKSGTKM